MAVVMLPHTPASATAARRGLVAELTALGVAPDIIADAELVIAEMVGNSVRHAQPLPEGGLAAGWELRDADVLVRVTDGGASTTPTVPCRIDVATSEQGRGLSIVAALAEDWGSERHGAGLRTWAIIGTHAPAPR
jgi:anti-sigma regulatory factor (Ser/Thr protein kinase)